MGSGSTDNNPDTGGTPGTAAIREFEGAHAFALDAQPTPAQAGRSCISTYLVPAVGDRNRHITEEPTYQMRRQVLEDRAAVGLKLGLEQDQLWTGRSRSGLPRRRFLS